MKRAKKICNLTMSKVSIHDALGATVQLTPVDNFSEPQAPQDGVYYIVEDIHEYPNRTDVVYASYAGTTPTGTILYALKDSYGCDVILDNVVFTTTPRNNLISRINIKV